MIPDVMVLMIVGMVVAFLPGAASAPCPSSTVQVNVTLAADLQNLTDSLACSGKGSFDITWYSSLTVTHIIEVSDSKDVVVTGAGFPSIRGAVQDDNGAGAMVDARAGSGIFFVSNGSSLRLIDLVLEGGIAEYGGAVDLQFSSSLFAFGCTFANNTASYGGAISSSTSEIYIADNTGFAGNTAQSGGAIYLYGNSSIIMDGSSSLMNNHAGENGGAVYLWDNSSMQVDGNASFVANSAAGDGGALGAHTNVSIVINGNTAFVNNAAENTGGALYSSTSCFVDIVGDTVFDNNVGRLGGGAVLLYGNSFMSVDGSTSFINNIAMGDGGAILAHVHTAVFINGYASFADNMALGYGGAITAMQESSINIAGKVSFAKNAATEEGGAVYVSDASSVQLVGNSIFDNNVAGGNGGAISAIHDSSIDVTGNALFVNNVAMEDGAVSAGFSSTVQLAGNTTFCNNSAAESGGAVALNRGCSMHTVGRTSFVHNYAAGTGGAIVMRVASSIHIEGENDIKHNLAGDGGGFLTAAGNCHVDIDGNTWFHNNSAATIGGAFRLTQTEFNANGNTSFTYNSANFQGGGACYATDSSIINIVGYSYFSHNSAYDGGAILADRSSIHIAGEGRFAFNIATREGGAIKTTDSSITIAAVVHGAELPSTINITQGLIETIIFIENRALDHGGALSIVNPVNLNIGHTLFSLNTADSGGAVRVTSTSWAAAEFKHCRFESNSGALGGAIRLDGDGLRIFQGSSFLLNVADEAGGALFNTGPLEIINTVFKNNTAMDGGLAIQSMESAVVVLRNVTFDGNILSCPSQTYSYTQETSPDRCRFGLACAQCLPDGCESDLGNVTIDTKTVPTCEPIPEGVFPNSTAITLQTFVIMEGYFRISADSPIVLECYREDSCNGGIDPSDYCAVGYKGPYCAVCAESYAPGLGRSCNECSGHMTDFAVAFSTLALVLVLLVVVLGYVHLLQRVGTEARHERNQRRRSWQGKLERLRVFIGKAIPLSAIRIVVVVVQIVLQFTEIAGVVYPNEYEAFLSGMALVNFDIGYVLSSSCFLSTNFYDRLVLVTVAPLVIFATCAGTYLIAKQRNRNSERARFIVKHKHLSVVLFTAFFVYSSVSFTVFQTFVCDLLDDGNSYLRADYSIACNTERHKAFLLYAGIMVCLYPVGIPAIFAFWLVRHRRELENPGRDTMSSLKSYRPLWEAYKPSCYFFEVVEYGRRIVLTAVAVFILPDTAEQIATVLFSALVFMFISEAISPFNSNADMWLYRWGNGIVLASMYVALLLRVDLTKEGSRSSSAMTILLVAAHVFMIFTVAVQTFLMVRGLCAPKLMEQIHPSQNRRAEEDGDGIELEVMDDM